MSNFNLRKFLVENKLTKSSKKTILAENAEIFFEDFEDVIYDSIQQNLQNLPDLQNIQMEVVEYIANKVVNSAEVQQSLLDFCAGDADTCASITNNLIPLVADHVEEVADSMSSEMRYGMGDNENYQDFEDGTREEFGGVNNINTAIKGSGPNYNYWGDKFSKKYYVD